MDTSKLDTTDKSVPTDFTCNPPEPIVWDNNKATVLGYLHEWNKFTKRNGAASTTASRRPKTGLIRNRRPGGPGGR